MVTQFILWVLVHLVVGAGSEPSRFDYFPSKFVLEDSLNCRSQCCFDYRSCEPFKVYFLGSLPDEKALTEQECVRHDEGKWVSNQTQLASNVSEACLVFISAGTKILETHCLKAMASLSTWEAFGGQKNPGRNHIIWSSSDEGVNAKTRVRYFGFAAFAQGHSDYAQYVSSLDVSISLRAGGKGGDAKSAMKFSKTMKYIPPFDRKYLLTFKGTGSNEAREFAATRLHDESEGIVILNLPLSCSRQREEDERCKNMKKSFNARHYRYADLFNSTFALVIPGRSPATFRLHEILASGCIPVFYGYDAFPLPYYELIPWSDFSLFLPGDVDIATIAPLLKQLKLSTRILEMQRKVEYYYGLYFSRGYDQNKQTALEIIQRRIESRDASREYRVMRSGCTSPQIFNTEASDSFVRLVGPVSILATLLLCGLLSRRRKDSVNRKDDGE